MISFYEQDFNLHQVRFGEMTIWYSFKMACAYKTKAHGLVIRKDAFNGQWGEITERHLKETLIISNNEYILSEKEVFKFNMDDQIKRTILQAAKEITLKGLKLC